MRYVAMLAGLVMAWTVCGCATPRQTDTSRTAIERLLLSTAADRAAEALDVAALAGKKAFLDVSQLEANDKGYAVGCVRDSLGRQGVRLVSDRKEAEVIIEARAGAMDTDTAAFFIGVPSIPLVIPGAGSVHTPELSVIKRAKQYATAKIALNTVSPKTGEQLHSTGPQRGQAYFTRWTFFLLVMFHTSDVPETKGTWY